MQQLNYLDCLKTIKGIVVDFSCDILKEQVERRLDSFLNQLKKINKDIGQEIYLGDVERSNEIRQTAAQKQEQLEQAAQQIKYMDHLSAVGRVVVDFRRLETEADVEAHLQALRKSLNRLASKETDFSETKKLDGIRNAIRYKRNEIEKAAEQQRIFQERLAYLHSISFIRYLELFKEKTLQMQEKGARRNRNYNQAASDAEQLCKALEAAKKNFLHENLSAPLRAKTKLKKDCEDAIKEVSTSLGKHREWRGAITQFLLKVLSVLTLHRFGLFQFRTDSVKKLDDFTTNVLSQLEAPR